MEHELGNMIRDKEILYPTFVFCILVFLHVCLWLLKASKKKVALLSFGNLSYGLLRFHHGMALLRVCNASALDPYFFRIYGHDR